LRVSFSGGGTDVPPYNEQYGGVVLSSTIKKYAYCSLAPTDEDGFPVNSMGCTTGIGSGHVDSQSLNGDADLARAAMKRMKVADRIQIGTGSDCPPGSGLGSSSALVVAIIGGLCAWSARNMDRQDVAEMAYTIERSDVGIPGGMQDQYAAAMGGFNLMQFEKNGVTVSPLSISPPVKNELEYRLLLCSTGTTRPSGGILGRQIKSYREKNPNVLDALHEIKKLTLNLHAELVHGRVEEFGSLLGEEWELKKRLDPAISNDEVDKLYRTALENGAVGGKLLGAGGGGYLLLFAEDGAQKELSLAVIKAGSRVENVRFENSGVETWKLEPHGKGEQTRVVHESRLSEATPVSNPL
jgi:D-glycero-alpha-D-manno-heptose-7-phosphate kinase